MSTLTPPIKWHGGKHYLASRIIALMPPHVHYVEPYAGGLAVLLAKDPEGGSEVVNDINRWLTTFWRVLQREDRFQTFIRLAQATPFSEAEFEWCSAFKDDCVEACDADPARAAHWFFVCCRQSLAGRMKDFATLSRTRTRRGMNEQASAWLTAVEGLPAVHERLKRVVVLNRPAVEVIHQQDGPGTLFYLDPPYYHPTRASTDTYAHEMNEMDHRELLATITHEKRQGKFMLSGYPSELYQEFLSGWKRHDFDLPNNASGGDSKRRMTECVWCNF